MINSRLPVCSVQIRWIARTTAMVGSVFPMVCVILWGILPAYGEGVPDVLPSFGPVPATSSLGDLFLLPQALVTILDWALRVFAVCVLPMLILVCSLLVNRVLVSWMGSVDRPAAWRRLGIFSAIQAVTWISLLHYWYQTFLQ